MAERLIFRISASARHRDVLKIQDVLAQVVDLFDMVSESESDVEGLVAWRLVSASTSSPVRIVAEATPSKLEIVGAEFNALARAQREEFVKNLDALRRGEFPEIWGGERMRRVVRRVLRRQENGIGEIDILPSEEHSQAALVTVLPQEAHDALVAIGVEIPQFQYKPKAQIGSLEGVLLSVSTRYRKPAVRFKERKSGAELWGVIESNQAEEIAQETNFADVWRGRRVLLRGRIEYKDSGEIARMYVSGYSPLITREVAVDEIRDESFTGGLSVSEYLEKHRNGDLG